MTEENEHVYQQPRFILMRIRGCQKEQQLSQSSFPSPRQGENCNTQDSVLKALSIQVENRLHFRGSTNRYYIKPKAVKTTCAMASPVSPGAGTHYWFDYLLTSVELVNRPQPVPQGEPGLSRPVLSSGSPKWVFRVNHI